MVYSKNRAKVIYFVNKFNLLNLMRFYFILDYDNKDVSRKKSRLIFLY
jgi:hypothetical protein